MLVPNRPMVSCVHFQKWHRHYSCGTVKPCLSVLLHMVFAGTSQPPDCLDPAAGGTKAGICWHTGDLQSDVAARPLARALTSPAS
jgi:hypothetical protein